jgi:hypothetical protein
METHIETTEGKAFRTFIRIFSLFKNERLRAKIKPAHHMALTRLVMTYTCPAWELAADIYLPLNIAAHVKQGPAHYWKFSKVHTSPRFADSAYDRLSY